MLKFTVLCVVENGVFMGIVFNFLSNLGRSDLRCSYKNCFYKKKVCVGNIATGNNGSVSKFNRPEFRLESFTADVPST